MCLDFYFAKQTEYLHILTLCEPYGSTNVWKIHPMMFLLCKSERMTTFHCEAFCKTQLNC